MLFGFMNSAEKAVYDEQMEMLLKDCPRDINGNVSKKDWAIADKIAHNMIVSMKKGGIL